MIIWHHNLTFEFLSLHLILIIESSRYLYIYEGEFRYLLDNGI